MRPYNVDRVRQSLFSWLTDWAIRLAPNRADPADKERRARRFTFRQTIAGWPLRMTTFLRDRLRPKWLSVKRNDDRTEN